MSGKKRISFRILGPDPFDFSREPRFSPDVQFSVEFPNRSLALKFQNNIQGFASSRRIHLERKGDFCVSWGMSWRDALTLPQGLDSQEIGRQMTQGLQGYAHDGFWKLRGPGRQRSHWVNRTQIM